VGLVGLGDSLDRSKPAGDSKIPIRDYLCSTLPGLADFPINRIAELTQALG